MGFGDFAKYLNPATAAASIATGTKSPIDMLRGLGSGGGSQYNNGISVPEMPHYGAASREALDQQFQAILGRPANAAERAYMSKLMDSGDIGAHEIGQILQGTPEFQNKLLEQNTTAFGNKLNQQNEAILGQAGNVAQARFAGLGRPQTSAIGASVGQAAGSLAQSRQSTLANFYGQGLNQQAQNYQAGANNALERSYGIQDENRQFIQNYQLAKLQGDQYGNAVNQANSLARKQAQGRAIGSGIGAIGGAVVGGPFGAAAGANVGGQFGGLF